MGRTKILGVAAALALSSSVAFAVTSAAHWMGSVTGKNGAKTTGSAMMMATTDGKGTEVTIDIKGETAGATRPWHVHVGTCAKGGGVFGGGRSYTPMTIDGSGAGASKATLAVAVPDTGSYHVNVHESAANMANIVACGDLMPVK